MKEESESQIEAGEDQVCPEDNEEISYNSIPNLLMKNNRIVHGIS